LVVDCMAGDGVYDLNQHDNPKAYQTGILKVLERYENETSSGNIPDAVQQYCQLVLQATGCADFRQLDVYPGSPVLAQKLLRPHVDEHRLLDAFVDEVQWLDQGRGCEFRPQQDCFALDTSLEFILPYSDGGKHPVILLDPDYQQDKEYAQVKTFMTTLLDQNPHATIVLWLPLLHNHPLRFAFAQSVREIAKRHAQTGRYYASIQIAGQQYQGSAVLVCNPPGNLDEVVSDETLHWLARAMHQGKDEFTLEQVMKKKKQQK